MPIISPFPSFFKTTSYSSNLLVSGTASASSFYPTVPPSNVVDGNEATVWGMNAGQDYPQWWRYDLGDGITKKITKVRVKPYSDGVSSPKDFKIQGSNDGTNFDDLYTNTFEFGDAWQEFIFTNAVSYRYYRLYLTNCYGSPHACGLYETEAFENL